MQVFRVFTGAFIVRSIEGIMTKEQYEGMTSLIREREKLARLIHMGNKVITGGIFLLYPMLLLYFLKERDVALIKAVIVPLDSFIIVTVFRYIVNRPRPYEKFGIPPIIPKDKKGQSFPSRHVFSAFMIAMTFLLYSPWQLVGIAMVIGASLLGLIRVLSGVHFISDVVAGAAVGILAGWIGYLVI